MRDSGHAARGLAVDKAGFEQYMGGRVGPRHLDQAGDEIIRGMFSRVAMSGFGRSALDRLLSCSKPESDWPRVGESIAECYLEDYEGAWFPYPYLRDAKSARASHAGPDLAGYSLGGPGGAGAEFLFGEVKTSGDRKHPPRVAYDLSRQLRDLCSDPAPRRLLVRRLCFKDAVQCDPHLRRIHRQAASSYLEKEKFRLAGVLIRSTGADEGDLGGVLGRVGDACGAARLDLIALYLPVKSFRGRCRMLGA